jgi:hypothetical protein
MKNINITIIRDEKLAALTFLWEGNCHTAKGTG